MAEERGPVYIAVAQDPTIAAGAGESVPIDLDLPLGRGARILAVDFQWGLIYQVGSSEALIGLSIDPDDPAPASRAALQANTDVLAMCSFQQHFTTSGYGVYETTIHRSLEHIDLVVVRNPAMLLWNDSGDVLVDTALRVYYKLVTLAEIELARLVARQR